MQVALKQSYTKSNKYPELKVHRHYMMNGTTAFYGNPNIEVWNKVIHLLIYKDRTNKYVFISNTGILKELNTYNADTTINSIKQAMRKLREMGFIKPVRETRYHVKDKSLRLTNGRILELNRARILDYLKVTSFDDPKYINRKKKSKEGRFMRKKIYSLVDWVNIKKEHLQEQYNAYVALQQKKYFYVNDDPQEITLESYQASQDEIYAIIGDIYTDTDVGVSTN